MLTFGSGRGRKSKASFGIFIFHHRTDARPQHHRTGPHPRDKDKKGLLLNMAPVHFDDFTRRRNWSVGNSHGFRIPPAGKFLIGAVACNVALILTYRVAVLVQLASGTQSSSDPNYNTDHIWFFCLTLETAGFMLYFAMDSVTSENHYELLAFVICAFFLGLRSLLEFFSQDPEAGDLCIDETGLGAFCVASTVIQVVFTLFYLIMAPIVWKSYGWRFYKIVGSDAKLSSMWILYQQFLSLKFLDLSFSLLVMTTGVIYLAFTVYGSIISVVYVFIELFWMRLGTLGIEKENNNAMNVWVGLSLLSPLYIIFFAIVAQQMESVTASSPGPVNGTIANGPGAAPVVYASAMQNPLIVAKMIVLASLALFNRIMTVLWGLRGKKNFGQGMLERVFPRMLPGAGEAVAAARNGPRVIVDDSTGRQARPIGANVNNVSNHGRGPSVFHDEGAVNVSNQL